MNEISNGLNDQTATNIECTSNHSCSYTAPSADKVIVILPSIS